MWCQEIIPVKFWPAKKLNGSALPHHWLFSLFSLLDVCLSACWLTPLTYQRWLVGTEDGCWDEAKKNQLSSYVTNWHSSLLLVRRDARRWCIFSVLLVITLFKILLVHTHTPWWEGRRPRIRQLRTQHHYAFKIVSNLFKLVLRLVGFAI